MTTTYFPSNALPTMDVNAYDRAIARLSRVYEDSDRYNALDFELLDPVSQTSSAWDNPASAEIMRVDRRALAQSWLTAVRESEYRDCGRAFRVDLHQVAPAGLQQELIAFEDQLRQWSADQNLDFDSILDRAAQHFLGKEVAPWQGNATYIIDLLVDDDTQPPINE